MDFGSRENRFRFDEEFREIYDVFIEVDYVLSSEYQEENINREAFIDSEQARSRGLLDLMTASTRLRNNEEVGKIHSLLTLSELLEINLESERKKQFPDETRVIKMSKLLKTTHKELKELDIKMPEDKYLLQAITPQAGSAPADMLAIGFGEALVEYYVNKENIYIFLITEKNEVIFKRSKRFTSQILKDTKEYFRRLMGGPPSQWQGLSKRLYMDLISPVASHLKEIDRLTIIAHDDLHILPFNTLLEPETNQPLIEYIAISYLPTATLRPYLRQAIRAQPTKGPLIIGKKTFKNFKNLKHTELEAIGVAETLPRSTLWIGSKNQFSKQTFLQVIESHSIIHIASHGFINPDIPLLSEIILQDEFGNDSTLTAFEVIGKNINAGLVTLSACETSLPADSNISSGNELFSLPWAFLYSGAQNVLASIWNADDQSTKDLMIHFYTNFQSNPSDGLDIALQSSQREIRRLKPHPYYWAPFMLIGDPR